MFSAILGVLSFVGEELAALEDELGAASTAAQVHGCLHSAMERLQRSDHQVVAARAKRSFSSSSFFERASERASEVARVVFFSSSARSSTHPLNLECLTHQVGTT